MSKSAADLLKEANPELRKQLRELGMLNFDKLLRLLGVDQVQVVICAEHEKDLSYQEISDKLAEHGIRMSRQSVGDRCKKCEKQ